LLAIRYKINLEKTMAVCCFLKNFKVVGPLEVKGEWVKVTYDCFYNDENNAFEGEPCHTYIDKCQNPVVGWLKWKQDNKILIDIFLMP
jgi:hypothetical protein